MATVPPGDAPKRLSASEAHQRFVGELDLHIRARYPLIYLVSWEEQRVDSLLMDLANTHGKELLAWSATRGLHRLEGGGRPLPDGTRDPGEALAHVGRLTDPSLVVLKDFHPYLNDPGIVRALRELSHQLKTSYTTAIILAPTLNVPVELEKEMSVLDVPLPAYRDLAILFREIVSVLRQGNRAKIALSNEEGERLVRAALGLTLSEAENAFAKAVARDQTLSSDDLPLILDEKKQIIRKNGLLEFFAADQQLGDVGGLGYLKTWLDARTAAFGEAARRFGLPEPRGMLLLGVQGCGKSLTAKAVASHWRMPLLRLDMGRMFSGVVGSSEENLRRAIKVAESVAPAVLWIDEIEKGLAGGGSSGNLDSGVSARVFGTLLTWLQEKTAPVFVVATANRIENLPPEMLRKGRFDEIFFVDLPSQAERRDIFRIHITRRKRDAAKFDLDALARRAAGFSGAEIEQAVVAALYHAFAAKRELEQADVERALAETFPLSATMKEEIERTRAWAVHRTRPASTPDDAVSAPAPIASRFGTP